MVAIIRPLLLFAIITCSTVTTAAEKPHTSVSIQPLALIHQALLPSAPAPDVILPPHHNLHDYALSIDDLKSLQQADILFWLGERNETFIAIIERQRKHRGQWYALAPGTSHAWLNPAQIPDLVNNMTKALQQHHPDAADAIEQSRRQLLADITDWQNQWQKELAGYQDTPFLLGHDAFLAMTEALGLHGAQIYRAGHSHGHAGGGARSLLQIQQQLADGTIRCALEEPDISFATMAGRFPQLQLYRLSPMAQNADSFTGFLHASAQTLADCLKGQ